MSKERTFEVFLVPRDARCVLCFEYTQRRVREISTYRRGEAAVAVCTECLRALATRTTRE